MLTTVVSWTAQLPKTKLRLRSARLTNLVTAFFFLRLVLLNNIRKNRTRRRASCDRHRQIHSVCFHKLRSKKCWMDRVNLETASVFPAVALGSLTCSPIHSLQVSAGPQYMRRDHGLKSIGGCTSSPSVLPRELDGLTHENCLDRARTGETIPVSPSQVMFSGHRISRDVSLICRHSQYWPELRCTVAAVTLRH